MKLSKIKLSVLFSVVAVLAVFACAFMVRADTGNNVSGYFWSSNIGWINTNDCSNTADSTTCNPNASYGVNISPIDGSMSGYAWSSNIGWITFNDSGCPTTGCTPGAHAVMGTDGTETITGWARACSVYASGCSGALKSSASLGQCNGASDYNNQGTVDTGDVDPQCEWDGYIALDSQTAGGNAGDWNLRVDTDKKSIKGYAWGSAVMGWIKSISGTVTFSGPTVQLVANPASIKQGASSTLTVTASNIDGANSCSFVSLASALTMTQNSDGTWTGNVSVSPDKTTPYTVNCTKGAQTASASATVTVTYLITPPGGGGGGNGGGGSGGNGGGGNGGNGGNGGGGYCATVDPQFAWDSDATSCTITEQGVGSVTVAQSSQAQGGVLGSDGYYYYAPALAVHGNTSAYTLQCTGGSIPVNIQATVATCTPDFIIVPSPTAVNMTLTGDAKTGSYAGSVSVAVIPQEGFSSPVVYSIGSYPSNVPASLQANTVFNPGTVSINGSTFGTSTLSFTVPAADVTLGETFKDIVIDGIGGNLTRTAKVTLTVGGTGQIKPVYKEF